MDAEGGAHWTRVSKRERKWSKEEKMLRDEDWTSKEEILTNLISAGIRKQTKRIPTNGGGDGVAGWSRSGSQKKLLSMIGR